MTTPTLATHFRDLHVPGQPLVLPNPWDAGSARILEGLGFKALASTSSGFALTQGRRDYRVSRTEALTHSTAMAAAVSVPVTADLENGFGNSAEDAAQTIGQAAASGLAGGSIEDYSGDSAAPILPLSLAVERIAAAAAAAAATGFVLTARAEAFLHGEPVLDEVIERLLAFQEAGADVLFAPGLPDIEAVRTLCDAVARPVNVLVMGSLRDCTLAQLAQAGVARVSVGGALAFDAYSQLALHAGPLLQGEFAGLSANATRVRAIAKHLLA